MNNLQNYLDNELGKVVFQDDTITDNTDDFDTDLLIAKEIIYYRNIAGLSQLELANKIGIQQASLSKIETGKGNPSIKILKRIAAGLNKQLIITLR